LLLIDLERTDNAVHAANLHLIARTKAVAMAASRSSPGVADLRQSMK
jgi:hypothetical protein